MWGGVRGARAHPTKMGGSGGARVQPLRRFFFSFGIKSDRQKGGDKDRVEAWIKELSGNGALAKSLNKANAILSDKNGNAKDLYMQPDALDQQCNEMERKLTKLLDSVCEAEKQDYSAMAQKVEIVRAEMDVLRVHVEEQVKSISETCAQIGKHSRVGYHAVRWQITKMKGNLVAKGHGVNLAKHIADRLFLKDKYDRQELAWLKDASLEEFDRERIALWDPAVEHALTEEVTNLMKANDQVVKDKIISLNGALAKHEKWPGSQGALSFKFGDVMLQDMIAKDVDGSGPWMGVARQYAPRRTVADFPCDGLPCFIYAISDIVVHVSKIEPLLKGSILLSDYDGFLEKESGETYLVNNTAVLKLPVGSVLFVPFGHRVHIVACDAHNDEKVGYYVHQPFISNALLEKSPSALRNIVMQTNRDQFVVKKDNTMWTKKASWFNKVFPVNE
jgi:hypothetical protein